MIGRVPLASLLSARVAMASLLLAAVAVNVAANWQAGEQTGAYAFGLVGLLAAGVLLHSQRTLERSEIRLRAAHRGAEAARAEAEAAQRLSSFRLAAIVESSSDAIVGTSPDGTITSWNRGAEQLYGYGADDVVGQSLANLWPVDRRTEVTQLLASVARGERLENRETVRLRKDGLLVDVSISLAPIVDAGGRIVGAATIERDVTERKRADREIQALNDDLQQRASDLVAANKELEAFSYSVSHDLRAPLRAMNGFSKILVEEYSHELSADARRYLGLVQDNAHQMGELVDDLLRFSRLSRQPLSKQRVEPAELARQTIEELRFGQPERPLQVFIGELPACEADPALLKQVFVNLLANALKFTQRRELAEISVGFADQDGECVYFVHDNGVGFDPRYTHKLFGVFQRLHRAEDYEGTGVGLAIVQRIIHRHGGRVWSAGQLDQGATFYFTLGGSEDRG